MPKAAYWKGERLWQNLQTWRIRPDRTLGRLTGVFRETGRVRADSRNYFHELTVTTAIRPATPVDDLDRQSTFNAALHQKHDTLMAGAASLGPVSWCDDDSQSGSVTSAHTAGPVAVPVSHGALGGGWVTEVGKYVLCRDAATGRGFVSEIEGRSGSTVTIVVQQDIAPGWEIVNVQMHYPAMAYLDFTDTGPNVPSVDFHRTGPSVEWRFMGGEGARLVIASQYKQALD